MVWICKCEKLNVNIFELRIIQGANMRKQPIFKNYASGVLSLKMLLFSEG